MAIGGRCSGSRLWYVSPIPGGPSEKLGIQPGDKIVKIDGIDVIGVDRGDVPKKLKGPKGTVVEVDIKRSGSSELLHYAITRDKIPMYSVDVDYMVNNYIGYIRINAFAMTTFDEFMKGLRELKEKGMTSIVK